MAKKMKIIHIGLGIRGCYWLETLRDYPAGESVGCVDTQPSQVEWVKSRFPSLRSVCYQELTKALNNVKADAAIISSPPSLHATHAIMALEAGLAVMVEAPMGISLEDGVRILETSRRTGSPVMVGQNYRYRRCEQTVQKVVREGKVGTLTHVSYVDRRTRPAQGNFLNQIDYSQLVDAGVHHFDSLRSILGVNPVRVAGRCGKAPGSMYQHGSTTEAILEMENNIHIQYYGSLTANRCESLLWIEGDRGVVRADQKRVWLRKRGWRFFLPVPMAKIAAGDGRKHSGDGTVALLDQLKAAVTSKCPSETSAEDNLWTLSMMDALMLSDKTGKLIDIAEIFRSAGVCRDLSSHDDRALTA